MDIDGYVVPAPKASKEAYQLLAEEAAVVFKEHEALSVMEAWGDDVPPG